MSIGEAGRPLDDGPQRLTFKGVPVDPNLRIMAVATLVNTFGNGALMTTFALYFTRVVGLRPTQVGLALSAGALAGLLVQVPAGHLADLRGPRGVLQTFTFGAGIAILGLLFARSVWALVVVMAVVSVFDRGAGAVRNGYIARLAEGGQAVQFKAYLRAMTNVGISFGALFGGVALWADQSWAYLAVFALDATTCVLTSIWLGRLPQIAPAPARESGEPRMAVLHDLPFVVITLLSGVTAMHFMVMELAMPLWISQYTSAPRSLVAITLMINTVSVALLQVRLTRGIDLVVPSSRAMARSGLWIAGGFALVAFASGQPAWMAIVLLCAGALVHVVGEMIGSAGQWGVQMGLAPRERQGQYQGFAGVGFSLSHMAAPTLITLLCIEWGRPGWFVLGGVIALASALMVPVSAWALRTRERYGVLTHSG
ncbi:MAG: MFS transporter [Dermatophilaceae bacterium]